MEQFDALTLALEHWFDRALIELPDALRQRVAQEFFPVSWETLTADQRRSVTLQWDFQNDPATKQDRQFWWDSFQRFDQLKKQVVEWETVATPTAAELAKKEARLAELQQEWTRMEAHQRAARGNYVPEGAPSRIKRDAAHEEPAFAVLYIAYPKAMQQLAQRLGASPEELAAWIFMGPEDGGIVAYVNANELASPPRFNYSYFVGTTDYVAPLMGCWFKQDDVDEFAPTVRYITGEALIKRWDQLPDLHARAFINAKIVESRLLDIHPICGMTRGTSSDHSNRPTLESGLFSLSDIAQIEAEDFDAALKTSGAATADGLVPNPQPEEKSAVGSPEWRRQNARAAANALHDKPGGNRDKQKRIREIWASGKYTSRDLCAEQECAALNMSISVARRALTNTPEPSRC